VTLGLAISDTATLSGVTEDAGGQITFHLYPSLDDCLAGTNEIDTSLQPVAVNGNGDYSSGEFTPTAAGTYYWTASYSGDDNNNDPADELSCAENEQSVVNEASTTTPELTTVATGPVTLGLAISDTATLIGATSDATGTITFSAYGPFTDADPTTDVCDETTLAFESDPVDIGSPDASGNYVVSSGDFIPSEVGRYQWVASYTSGDDNNEDVSSPCNAEGEQSVVNEAQTTTPELTTQATESATLPNDQISDQATLTAPDGTDGNIVFRLYGPFTTAPTATDCTADKLVTAYGTNGAATVQVVDHTAASNPYTAPSFTPTTAGIYQWTAQFNSTTSGVDSTTEFGCADATEQSVVAEAPTTTATEQLTTLALDHKEQRLLEIKEKLRADETPQEQKEALQERRKQLREELKG
jgi:hypothetical protein